MLNFDQPAIPGRVHPLFGYYVRKMSAEATVWRQDGKELTASQVVQELDGNTSLGLTYAQDLLCQLYDIVRGPHRKASPAARSLDVTVAPRDLFMPLFQPLKASAVVWKTMSGNFTAGQMEELVKLGHSDAGFYLDRGLQLACDLLAADTCS